MPTTIERVDRLEQVLASFMEHTDEIMADIRTSNARTDALLLKMQQQAEKDRQQAEKDRQRADARFQEMQQKAEKDRQQAEKERKEFNRHMAGLSDSMGRLVDDMVAPNAARIASEIFPDDPVVTVSQRIKRKHPTEPGRLMEIDLLVAARRHVMVVESKWRLNAEKIREYVEKLAEFHEFFPEHAGCQVAPVAASLNIDPSVVSFLNRQKVYGLAMGDETMQLVNLGQF